MSEKDINNLKEMIIDFDEYDTDYTKTRCRELEETIENTLKEIERLNNIIEEVNELLEEYKYTNVEEYGKIIEFYKKLRTILDKGEIKSEKQNINDDSKKNN